MPVSNELAIDNPTKEFEIDMYSLVSLADIDKMFASTYWKRISINTFITTRIIMVLIEKIRMIFFQNPNFKNHCFKSEHFFNIKLFILIHFSLYYMKILCL